jgi:hypothetical protein
MKMVRRLNVGSLAVLVLLVLLTVLVVKRKGMTPRQAGAEAMLVVLKVKDTGVRDTHAAVAILIVLILFCFAIWAAVQAPTKDEERASPRQPSAGSSS